ncbi:hypothetical protein [Streptomyces sp. 35G-GA-8]|uniref:hypothetical protein n=1 Tax=Streptomyces sp. 35G-GA-8 TaxID=2939434 RepID=UPI00201EBC82|nr:hypothetical protein [Streptomyces sp. 35G-GA-8]MCL7382216.1 hypothetical protein [Streptomyces sp. 35G-GA-8]
MTKDHPSAAESDGVQEHEHGDVVAVHETAVVQTRLLKRTCGYCGKPVTYAGTGRPPKYCSDGHRKLASAERLALARAGRSGDDDQSSEPVREVVERTVTVTQTVVRQGPVRQVPATRLSGEPYTLPADPIEWAQALAYLRGEATRFLPAHRASLAQACELTARVLRSVE